MVFENLTWKVFFIAIAILMTVYYPCILLWFRWKQPRESGPSKAHGKGTNHNGIEKDTIMTGEGPSVLTEDMATSIDG